MFSLGDAMQYAPKRLILGSLGYQRPKLCLIRNMGLGRILFHNRIINLKEIFSL